MPGLSLLHCLHALPRTRRSGLLDLLLILLGAALAFWLLPGEWVDAGL